MFRVTPAHRILIDNSYNLLNYTNSRLGSGTISSAPGTGELIGEARVYSFGCNRCSVQR